MLTSQVQLHKIRVSGCEPWAHKQQAALDKNPQYYVVI